MKASINGPNRRKNRVGDKTVASSFDDKSHHNNIVHSSSKNQTNETAASFTKSIPFKVRSLEKFLEEKNKSRSSCSDNELQNFLNEEYIGDACLFTVNTTSEEEKSGASSSMCSGELLLQQHFQMSKYVWVRYDENRPSTGNYVFHFFIFLQSLHLTPFMHPNINSV